MPSHDWGAYWGSFIAALLLIIVLISIVLIYFIQWIGGITALYLNRKKASPSKSRIAIGMIAPPLLCGIALGLYLGVGRDPLYLGDNSHINMIFAAGIPLTIFLFSIITVALLFAITYLRRRLIHKDISNRYLQFTIDISSSAALLLITITLLGLLLHVITLLIT